MRKIKDVLLKDERKGISGARGNRDAGGSLLKKKKR